jgi:ornithine cyclodeaminase/thiomorpholine-carboxylate dehydrogenase
VGCAELAGVPPERAVQLGEVIGGAHPGRISDDELTLYKAMGNVVEDIVAASIVYERAKARGLGTRVAL